jgi:hypothetical protein
MIGIVEDDFLLHSSRQGPATLHFIYEKPAPSLFLTHHSRYTDRAFPAYKKSFYYYNSMRQNEIVLQTTVDLLSSGQVRQDSNINK